MHYKGSLETFEKLSANQCESRSGICVCITIMYIYASLYFLFNFGHIVQMLSYYST